MRVLHQAWHYDTRDQTPEDFVRDAPGAVVSVAPALDADEIDALRAACALVARYIRTNKLPYALQQRDAMVTDDGTITLRSALGLTCATFLLVVLERARIRLIDAASWAEITDTTRLDADREVQARIVRGLRGTAKQARAHDSVAADAIDCHADAVERDEVGCPRVRAEEIAAAFGVAALPAPYAAVEPEGRALLAALEQANTAPPH